MWSKCARAEKTKRKEKVVQPIIHKFLKLYIILIFVETFLINYFRRVRY
jgi:hypothetical protein